MAKKTLFKRNDTVVLTIEDITNLGFGVGRCEGAVVFVSGAVTGDVIEAKIIKTASSYYIGKLLRIIKSSPLSVSDRCDNTRCRSCAYRDISYEEELKIKRGTVISAFAKAGLSDVEILPTLPSPRLMGYRNKAQYPITRDKNGDYRIGFYAPKSHTVCEAAECAMAPKIFSEILELLRGFFKKHNISTYDETSGTGLLRHIYLRRSETFSEVLLTVVINGNALPHSDELCRLVTEQFPEICGILLNINTADTNIILGDEYVTLFGRDYINDVLAGVKLRISASSFYQVNHGSATLIYERARELAALNKNDTLLDLFCGAGSIGLSMAADCRELIGIEIVESAVECARLNAKENGIENASFYIGDAANTEEFLKIAETERGETIRPDVVILDPPRAGSAEKLLEFIATLAPRRVVYISCNPTTLARDVEIMKRLGFAADKVLPVDMFPMTGHVESVVCLSRK